MTIVEEKEQGVTRLAIGGRLDISTCDRFEQRLNACRQNGDRKFLIDLHGLEYISSAGLRVLLALLQRLDEEGGAVALARTQEYVLEVLEVAGLDTVFSLYPDLESAQEALQSS